MKNKIPQILTVAGVVLLVVSVVWWQQTFGISFDYIKCLGSSGGLCRVSSLGKLFGNTVYNPLIFWAGLICLVAGIILKKLRIL